jgi:1,2-diacylglycerol-3-alpha-glucose alpha-1,2-galactosyltransferase
VLLRDLELYEDILFDYYLKEHDNEGFMKAIQKLKNDSDYYQQAKEKSIRGHKFYSRESVLGMWKSFYKKVLLKKDR